MSDSIDNVSPSYYINWTFDKHFILMQDIGNVSHLIGQLLGSFYGAGHTITAIINFDDPNLIFSSLYFFSSFRGIIDSFILDGNINTNGSRGSGIVGSIAHTSIIVNCINNATTECFPCEYEAPFGIKVSAIASFNEGTISHCINNGSMSGVARIAGIASDNSGQIINCINTGKITSFNSGNGIFSGVGGIVGTSSNGHIDISNCINLGSIEGQGFVGGIVGLVNAGVSSPSPITNCINLGYVKGTNSIGGILGMKWNYLGSITNCINTGVIEGEENVGSIVGKE